MCGADHTGDADQRTVFSSAVGVTITSWGSTPVTITNSTRTAMPYAVSSVVGSAIRDVSIVVADNMGVSRSPLARSPTMPSISRPVVRHDAALANITCQYHVHPDGQRELVSLRRSACLTRQRHVDRMRPRGDPGRARARRRSGVIKSCGSFPCVRQSPFQSTRWCTSLFVGPSSSRVAHVLHAYCTRNSANTNRNHE